MGTPKNGAEFEAPRNQREALEQAKARAHTTPIARATNVVGTAALGGDTVPDEMMRPLEVNMLAFGGMRAVATIVSTSTGASLPIPSANDVTIKAAIVAEDALVPDQEIAFGQRTLGAYKYSSKIIPFSMELLQDSATNLPNLVGRVTGERMGRGTNEHFTTGDGLTEPEGILENAADSGVTAGTAGEIDWKELTQLIHSVDPAYRQLGARFMFSDATLSIIKQMEDSQGRPLVIPSVTAGEGDRILGYPYQINQDMPAGAASKGVIFGALSKFMIREVRGLTLVRLNERYAEYGRVAFISFARYDSKLIDAGTAPVKYMTLA